MEIHGSEPTRGRRGLPEWARYALIALGVAVLVAAGGTGAWVLTSKARQGSAVAARVNGDAIYWSQVDAEVARAAAQFGLDPDSDEFKKQRDQVAKVVIDQLVAQRIVLQEGRRRNITASDKEVDEQLATIRQRFPGEAEFNTALAKNGLTLAGLRDMIRISATQRHVADAVATATVSDDEVRKQYDSNPTLYDKPAQIRVSHILLRIAEKSAEPIAAAKAKIVQARLADGARFEDMAKQYSEDPGSAERGGDLGFVSKGTLVKEFEAVAWALKPGGTSEPVRTQYGLHIIRVHEVRAAEKGSFEKVREEIRAQLLGAKREKAFDAWLAAQQKAAKVERFERLERK